MHAKLLQFCLALWDPIDHSPSDPSVCGIFQARTLESVAISFSRGSSWPRDQNCISWDSCIAGRLFITEPLRKHLKPRLLVPIRRLADCSGLLWGLSTGFVFLTRSQVMLMLLVWRPHVRNHCYSCCIQRVSMEKWGRTNVPPCDSSLILPWISVLLSPPTLHAPTASPRSVSHPIGPQP